MFLSSGDHVLLEEKVLPAKCHFKENILQQQHTHVPYFTKFTKNIPSLKWVLSKVQVKMLPNKILSLKSHLKKYYVIIILISKIKMEKIGSLPNT